MKNTQARNEKLKMVNDHLNWIFNDVHPNDKKRAIEQCFGFIQGVMFFNDDKILEKMLMDFWTEWYCEHRFK